MHLHTLLNTKSILINPTVNSKNELISKLLDTLNNNLDEAQKEQIYASILEREAIMPTGIGKGIGIPHCKTDAVKQHYAAMAVMENEIDYKALDASPVFIVILLISPKNSDKTHIQLLSSVSKLLNKKEIREEILKAENSQKVYEIIKKEEIVN